MSKPTSENSLVLASVWMVLVTAIFLSQVSSLGRAGWLLKEAMTSLCEALGLDPSQPPQLTELPHTGLHRLFCLAGEYYIKHLVTLETKQLPTGHVWSLALHNGRSFVSSASHPPIWISDVLSTSLWKDCEQRMILWAPKLRSDGGDLIAWVDEVSRQHAWKQQQLTCSAHGHTIVNTTTKIYMFDLPRARASVFWEVNPVGKACVKHVKDAGVWVKQNMRRRWLPLLQNTFLIPAEHYLVGRAGQRAMQIADNPGVIAHQASISTVSLLLLLREWCSSLGGAGGLCAEAVFKKVISLPGPILTVHLPRDDPAHSACDMLIESPRV